MKRFVFNTIFIFVVIVVLIISAIQLISQINRIPVEPEVEVSNEYHTYSTIDGSYWCPPIYDEFNEKYNVKYYSRDLQVDLIDIMKDKAKDLGENPDKLETCIEATGIIGRDNPIIPCYADKIQMRLYQNVSPPHMYLDNFWWQKEIDYMYDDLGALVVKECWVIVCNWGAPGENYGHIRIYVVSIDDATIRYSRGCM